MDCGGDWVDELSGRDQRGSGGPPEVNEPRSQLRSDSPGVGRDTARRWDAELLCSRDDA